MPRGTMPTKSVSWFGSGRTLPAYVSAPVGRRSRRGPWPDRAAWFGPCRPPGHPHAGEHAVSVADIIHLPQQRFLGDLLVHDH
jgi:hypothetical protein